MGRETDRQTDRLNFYNIMTLLTGFFQNHHLFEFFKIKRKSEALFKNHVTSYSTLEGDVTCSGFKSMLIYGGV